MIDGARRVVVIAGVDVGLTSARTDPPNFPRGKKSPRPSPPPRTSPVPERPPPETTTRPLESPPEGFPDPFVSASALCTMSSAAGVAVAHTHAYPTSANTARAAFTPWYPLSRAVNAMPCCPVTCREGGGLGHVLVVVPRVY